ncbi:RNA polymerase sigma factor [Kordia zhangzhouensis]|uniref:RNA polymerase sigma factor n=1 Tax=Kordia zhangzhouensis TaxID=1620405 RepID=UPI000629A9F1|nr:sigma-70 family RNA polymerase sigma factor [Kordia zhangzhouensis]
MKEQSPDLQARLRNDDKNALEEVYLTYKEAFVNYGLRFNLDKEDVIDVYQDTVIAVYQNFVIQQKHIDNSSLKTYVFSIGKYKIYDRLREQKQFVTKVDAEDSYEEIKQEELVLSEEQTLLQKHFRHLGKSCQEILRLYYYRNLTVQEIVESTHYKDQNTVKSHKSRCLKKLIALIKDNK